MIHLITGQPGAGKTLYALHHVRELAERESRPVYFSGIADCKVPGWIELDKAEEWHKLPSGAVVVIDEAQRIFRPRGNGSTVPEHVSLLETHRHRGLDLFIITQHPMLVDTNVRRLVGRHVHVMRSFGMQRATIHEWGTVKEQCDKSREDSNKTEWAYPREAFALYQSAELHTHKRKLPKRLIFLLVTPLLLAACVFGFWRWYQGFAKPPVPASPVPTSSTQAGAVPVSSGRPGPMTTAAMVASYSPRLAGLPHTASRYDEITKPYTAPVPVMCVATATRCQCYSQQATRIDAPEETCRGIAAHGYFVDFQLQDVRERERESKQREQVARSSSFKEQAGSPPSVGARSTPRGIAGPPGDPLRSNGEQGPNGGPGQGLVEARGVSVGFPAATGGTPGGGAPRPQSALSKPAAR